MLPRSSRYLLVDKSRLLQSVHHIYMAHFKCTQTSLLHPVSQIKPCDGVLVFTVPDDVAVDRLVKRGESSGRADDTEETIRKRMQVMKTRARKANRSLSLVLEKEDGLRPPPHRLPTALRLVTFVIIA